MPSRLSTLLAPLMPHSALVFLVADAAGGQRDGAGAASFVDGVSFLALDEVRRMLGPGHTRRAPIATATGEVEAFHAVSSNGALLVLANREMPTPTRPSSSCGTSSRCARKNSRMPLRPTICSWPAPPRAYGWRR